MKSYAATKFNTHPVLRFLFKFIAIAGAFYIATWLFLVYITPLYSLFAEFNAEIAGYALRAFGEQVAFGNGYIVSTEGAVYVTRDCAAIEPSYLYLSAISAYPAAWRMRIIGSAMGIVVLLTLNLFRIAWLYWLDCHNSDWFGIVHDDIAPWALIGIAGMMFWLWVRGVNRKTIKP